MSLKKEQEYLVGLTAEQFRNAETHYWDIFGLENAPDNTSAKTINFEDITNKFVAAKAIPSGGNVPILDKDGVQLVSITPSEIGSGVPLEPETSIERTAGQAVYNGQVINTKDYNEVKAVTKLGESIASGKNRIATDIFFNGTHTNNLGVLFSFALNTAEAVTASNVNNWNIWLADEVRKIKRAGAKKVMVMAGSNVIEKMINEINTASGKKTSTALTYSSTQYDEINDYNYLETQTVGLTVVQYPLAYAANGDEIDTSNKIHIFGTKGLVQAHAGIKAELNGRPEMIMDEMWMDIESGTKQNPSELLFAKSAPMVGVLRKAWFNRYTVTFA